MKVVLDTNVLLNALGTRGLCEAVLALREYHGISILDPRSFYDRLRSDRP